MQPQLALLRRPPGEALGELVMIEGVEHAHHDLDRDQSPQQRRHEENSRNLADWRRMRPKRGWTISSVKRNAPPPRSEWVTVRSPGVSHAGSLKRTPVSWSAYPVLRNSNAASATAMRNSIDRPKPRYSCKPVG